MGYTFIKQKALAILMAAVLTICGVFTGSGTVLAEGGSVYPEHEPYGTGVGAQSGRVVWFHDKDSVDWDGNGYWWDIGNFNEEAVQKMVDESIASLAGEENAGAGWDTLFLANNSARGKEAAYARGEKIAIKANINGSGVFDDDDSGETKMSYTNPVLLKCLLRSLVNEAGVSPEDITVYDVSRIFPKYMVELCTDGELQGVHFVGRKEGIADTDTPINWSYSFSGAVNYLPTCVTEAEYVINLANLKGHSYGITLCAKNHFGSFINGNAMRPPEGANLHQWLTKNEMGIYSPLVDLIGNYQIGAKTVLYLLDALICAPSEGASITKANATWQQSPFDGDYTSSIFLSQDPVAIDSVGADFLMNEPAVTENNSSLRGNPNVENYLHEAGLVKDAPSGNVYYDGNGSRLLNLGVHEHWNNGRDKQYGRNLGKEEGIELVPLTAQKGGEEPEQKSKTLVAYFSCTDTTKTLAEYAAEILDADSYRILPEVPYTAEDLAYYTNGRADREQNDPSVRPAISGNVEAMEQYDTIVLGYPIWHGQAPRIISTFLESYDFSGKTIVPFCTSHSSGIGSSAINLHALCPDSLKWEDGKRFGAGTSKEEIEEWLAETGIWIPDISDCSHDYTGRVTKEADCTTAGETTYTCTKCGESYTETIPAAGHTPVTDPAIPAGCETPGKTEGSHCEICGQEIMAQKTISATGHTPVTDSAIPAGCETQGKTEGSHCEICGQEIMAQKTIPATGHTPVTDPAIPARCETPGKTEGSHCEICGQEIMAQKTIPAIGHTLQTNIEKAGINQKGHIAEKCTVCGKIVSENEIDAVKSIRLSKTSYTYNGKNRKPSVTVTNSQDRELKEGTDYIIIYPAAMKNVGIYTVKIVFQGNYAGTEEQTFQIVPKNTSIVKLAPGKKGFTAKWKKQSKQTTGYEIAYSASSKFPEKKTGTIRIGKSNTISKKVSKLKANKKYYVRIRTYKTVKVQGKQKKVYSGWSKVKTVRTKK